MSILQHFRHYLQPSKVMNPLDINVSYYPGGVTDTHSTVTVNLFEYLTQPTIERIAKVQAVRACTDPVRQGELKKDIGGITPSGIFSPVRADGNLIQHSGIITLDIDADQNKELDFANFRTHIQKYEWVAACMISVRGSGLAIYIPIEQPENHRRYFESLSAEFTSMGVTVDRTCSNLSRLRFDSYDPNIYINPQSTRYNRLSKVNETAPRRVTYAATSTNVDVFTFAASLVKREGISFDDGTKHDFIMRLSCILNRYGVPEPEVWKHVSSTYMPISEIQSNCITGPYRSYANEHGKMVFKPMNKQKRYKSKIYYPRPSGPPKLPEKEMKPIPEKQWHEIPPLPWDKPTTDSVHINAVKYDHPEPEPHLPLEYFINEKDQCYTESWEQEITELENYFSEITLPTGPFKLSPHESIANVKEYVISNLVILKANPGVKAYRPYLDRLNALKRRLSNDLPGI